MGSDDNQYSILNETAPLGKTAWGLRYRGFDANVDTDVEIFEFNKIAQELEFNYSVHHQDDLWDAVKIARKVANDIDYVVHVKDVVPSKFWVITEPQGRSLRSLIQETPLTQGQARSFLLQSLDCLATFQERRFTHGDISPDTIFLPRQETTSVSRGMRFKFYFSPGAELAGSISRTGNHKYYAPEMCTPGFGQVTPRADMYILAFATLELLAGARFDSLFQASPELSDGELKTLWKMHHGSTTELPPIRDLMPNIGEDLEAVLTSMLRKKIGERLDSATEARAMIDRDALNDESPVWEKKKAVAKGFETGQKIEDGGRVNIGGDDDGGGFADREGEEKSEPLNFNKVRELAKKWIARPACPIWWWIGASVLAVAASSVAGLFKEDGRQELYANVPYCLVGVLENQIWKVANYDEAMAPEARGRIPYELEPLSRDPNRGWLFNLKPEKEERFFIEAVGYRNPFDTKKRSQTCIPVAISARKMRDENGKPIRATVKKRDKNDKLIEVPDEKNRYRYELVVGDVASGTTTKLENATVDQLGLTRETVPVKFNYKFNDEIGDARVSVYCNGLESDRSELELTPGTYAFLFEVKKDFEKTWSYECVLNVDVSLDAPPIEIGVNFSGVPSKEVDDEVNKSRAKAFEFFRKFDQNLWSRYEQEEQLAFFNALNDAIYENREPDVAVENAVKSIAAVVDKLVEESAISFSFGKEAPTLKQSDDAPFTNEWDRLDAFFGMASEDVDFKNNWRIRFYRQVVEYEKMIRDFALGKTDKLPDADGGSPETTNLFKNVFESDSDIDRGGSDERSVYRAELKYLVCFAELWEMREFWEYRDYRSYRHNSSKASPYWKAAGALLDNRVSFDKIKNSGDDESLYEQWREGVECRREPVGGGFNEREYVKGREEEQVFYINELVQKIYGEWSGKINLSLDDLKNISEFEKLTKQPKGLVLAEDNWPTQLMYSRARLLVDVCGGVTPDTSGSFGDCLRILKDSDVIEEVRSSSTFGRDLSAAFDKSGFYYGNKVLLYNEVLQDVLLLYMKTKITNIQEDEKGALKADFADQSDMADLFNALGWKADLVFNRLIRAKVRYAGNSKSTRGSDNEISADSYAKFAFVADKDKKSADNDKKKLNFNLAKLEKLPYVAPPTCIGNKLFGETLPFQPEIFPPEPPVATNPSDQHETLE